MLQKSLFVSMLMICAASVVDNGGYIERQSDNTEEAASIFWRIERDPDLTLDDVRKIIDEFECFQQMPDRSGTNPFTGDSVTFAGEGKAIYIEDAEAMGNLVLEEGRILFTGVPEAIVKDAAKLVSGNVLPWDSS